jgi:hypothetical protein
VVLCPPRFDHDDGLQAHPIPMPLQPFDRIGHSGATPFHSPVACGLGLVRDMSQAPILLFIGPLEEQFDIGI